MKKATRWHDWPERALYQPEKVGTVVHDSSHGSHDQARGTIGRFTHLFILFHLTIRPKLLGLM